MTTNTVAQLSTTITLVTKLSRQRRRWQVLRANMGVLVEIRVLADVGVLIVRDTPAACFSLLLDL